MSNRYADRRIVINDDDLYAKSLEKRNLRKMQQYDTARLNYPTVDQIKNLTRTKHIWKTGDRYYKLSAQYYGTTEHWWIIAFYNQRPTEADVKVGDIIYIPLPLERIVQYLGE
jgi:nucleoid-associated protein YgaU